MYLEKLSNLTGVAGYEHKIRKYIKDNIEKYVDSVEVDPMGNLLCYKKGKSRKNKVLIAAHMDEVGFIITQIGKEGFISFTTSGGIDPRVLPAKRVVIGNNEIPGVIHWKPPHLTKKKDSSIPVISNLIIDIGADSDKEAEKKVSIGDFATFDSKFSILDKNIMKGKAFDDRIGCSLLMDFLKEKSKFSFDIIAAFTVQEEIGLRGAAVLGEKTNPDICLVVEGTAAADFPRKEDEDISIFPTLGKGPVITITDKSIIVDRRLIDAIVSSAKRNKIKYQFKQPNIGGTDAGRIHKSRTGIPSAIISVPARYIHSPISISYLSDYKESFKLIKASLTDMLKAVH